MLKITEQERMRGVHALLLEGSIAGAWVAELQRACEPLLDGNGALIVDCAGVSFIDQQGVALARALIERGASFVNCSPYAIERLKLPA